MDPSCSGQDVVRCNLCRDAVAPMHCSVCHIHLCNHCVENHLSEAETNHNVVSLQQHFFDSIPSKCPDHPTKQCELYCGQCDMPICELCITSGKHEQHKTEDIWKNVARKKEVMQRDLQELEKTIYPKYQEAASNIAVQREGVRKHSQKLTTALNKHGEDLQKEIHTIIQQKQSEIDDMSSLHLAAIDSKESEIIHNITMIKQIILDLKTLLETSDVCLVSKYESRNAKYRKLPPKLRVIFPNFHPQEINKEQLCNQLGSFSPLSIETESHDITMKSSETDFLPLDRRLLDTPRLLSEFETDYTQLYNLSCLSDEEIWTSGTGKIMKLFNLKGELLKTVQTKSGNVPKDMVVIRSGELVYADTSDNSLNLVSTQIQPRIKLLGNFKKSTTKIQPLVTLKGWRPLALCCTSSDDLLVTMNSDENKQTKVVRYSGSIEKQSIQWDERGQPLYKCGGYNKYLSENKNFDICVADNAASAVVVVSATGKLRFRYTGLPNTIKGLFDPVGITTDNQGNILAADNNNQCIHLVDQDGLFLRYIDSCGLRSPWGLCLDSSDNLYVAEIASRKVKKI